MRGGPNETAFTGADMRKDRLGPNRDDPVLYSCQSSS